MANDTENSGSGAGDGLEARAREWLDAAQARWRLQTMQHRVRHNARTGEDTKLPTRIRRFLNGTPVGMKDAVLEILAETSPYESPVYDCEETTGLRYRPTNTFIRKDGPEHTTGGKDPTYTIIQDLLLVDARGDSLGVRSESSCSRLSETEYVWDAAEVADADVGGQGVSYEVVNVSRDRETDLFSYQLRRVVALTQHSPAQVVECDSRHTVTEEAWDNLYGGPGAFRKDGEESHGAGAAVAVPAPCSSPEGTTVAVDARQNADCTYRVVVRTSVAHADRRGRGSSKTAFERNEWEASANQPSALAPAPAASNGVVVKRESEKNPDGTWNNREDTTTEALSVGARVVKRKTLRGVTTSTTDRNTTDPTAAVVHVGDQVEVERTPGGRYNRTVTSVDKTPVGEVGSGCETTVFEHRHQTLSNVATKPAAETPPADGGKTYRKDVRQTEEGTFDVTETTTEEKPVRDAVVETRRTLRGTQRSVTHRNQPSPLPEAERPGESVTVRRTDGGLYDNTQSTVEVSAPGRIARSVEASMAETTLSETTVVPAESIDDAAEPVANPAQNVMVERSARMNEDGATADVTTRTRILLPEDGDGESQSGDGEVKTTTTTKRNAAEKAELADLGPDVNRRVEVTNTPNGAGGWNTTEQTTAWRPVDTDEVTLWKDEENECVMRSFRNQEEHDGLFPQDDVRGEINASLRKNDHGSWDGEYTIVRPRTDTGAGGVLIVDEGKAETFAVVVRYGRWEWTDQLNVTGWLGRAWEYRRVCTMKARYVNLTKARAKELAKQTISSLTRTVWGSEWDGSVQDGMFLDRVIGSMCMAKVFPYRISGDVWGVRIIVDEQTTRLSRNMVSPSGKFGIERGWGYPGE